MRRLLPTAVLAAFSVCAALAGVAAQERFQGAKFDFDKDLVDGPPKGLAFVVSGGGKPGVWVVQTEPDEKRDDKMRRRNILVQTDSDASADRSLFALYNDPTQKMVVLKVTDVDLSVQFKPISGKGDQAAGFVWRYRDEGTYYLTQCSAVGNSCTIDRVVNGRRDTIQKVNAKVATGVWHALRIDAIRDRFMVLLDGKKVLEAKDSMIKEDGNVGLWTHADSVVAFNDFAISGRRGKQ